VDFSHDFFIIILFFLYQNFISGMVCLLGRLNSPMNQIISILVLHLEDILRHGGYWVIGLVSVVEALPLIGTIVPGHTVVIFGGFFAHQGFLNVYLVAFWAAVGALTGDVIGYLLGKKYGMKLVTDWSQYFLIKQKNIDKAREALNKHSGKAIIFGRFNPVARVFMPFLAGASGMAMRRFWVFDAIAAISWSVISVAVGYLFGASYQIIAHTIGKFTTVGIVLVVLLVAAYYFVNSRRHIFKKYDFHILIVCIISLYFFFQTVEDAFVAHPFLVDIDVAINSAFAAHVMPAFVTVAVLVSDVLSPITLGVAAVALGAWWIYKKHWHNLYIFLFAYPTGLFLGYLLKIAIGRPRPPDPLVQISGLSFPSTHALASALFFTLVVYFFAHLIKGRHLRELFIVGNVLLVIMVCVSRLYLGVHWFSDVLAGSMFGLFWATFSILAVRYLEGLTRGRGAKKVRG
jgi:membrane protein DedA with SNARE-associated domain/membrane-associated phospholipid phosphatase